MPLRSDLRWHWGHAGQRQKNEEVVRTGDLSLQVQMVAGLATDIYLQLWRPAA